MAISKEIRKQIMNCYFKRDKAELLLEQIGFPPNRFPSGEGDAFWMNVFREIDNGILPNQGQALVDLFAEQYPYSQVFSQGASAPSIQQSRQGASLTVYDVEDFRGTIAQVREIASSMNLIVDPSVTSEDQLSFNVDADPQRLQALVLAVTQRLRETGTSGNVGSVPFRDYVIRQIIVEGPDTARYEIVNLPASTRTADLGAGVLGLYPKNPGERPRNYVIDNLRTGQRMNPDLSLHENDVREGDTLATSPEGTAGMIHPTRHSEALTRARLQILQFAKQRRGFLVTADAIERPTQYRFEFSEPSWGPPLGKVEPEPIEQHRVSLLMPPSFPLTAPTVYWLTPIFHPNIDPAYGFVCLGELRDGWRPNTNFSMICQMLVDLAGFRNYEVKLGLNKAAQDWATSPQGQAAIEQRGGVCLLHKLVQSHHSGRKLDIRRL